MKECILEANLEGQMVVSNSVYHFWVSNLGFEIFLKKRKHQKKGVLKKRTGEPLHILHWGLKKIPRKACLLFCNKKNSKSSISFHSLIIKFIKFL